MKEKVLRILTNHSQSSFEGLHQITGGDKNELSKAVEDMLTDGLIVKSRSHWNGIDWIVYKLNRKKDDSNRLVNQ